MASDELSELLHRWERVAVLCDAPQASVQCYIGREHSTSWTMTVVNEWINENHLIWTLCAALADSGLDQEWTHRFDLYYRREWRRIQLMVQVTQGAERLLLNIRPPPMLLAVFAHHNGSTARYHAIISTPARTRADGGLLNLLRHVYHGGISSTDVFDVVLCGEGMTGIAPESPPYSALGLPDHYIPVLNLPPPYENTPGSDWSELFSERYPTPPPPYRGTSPAPPSWTPPS